MPFKRILVSADESRSSMQGIHIAALIAKAMDAQVTVAHVVPIYEKKSGSGPSPSIEEYSGESIVANAKSTFAKMGLKVRTDLVKHRDPLKALLYLAKEGWYDLIVLGCGKDDRWEMDSVGSVAMGMVKRLSASILVTKKNCGVSRLSVLTRSEEDLPLVDMAIELAIPFGARLSVLMVRTYEVAGGMLRTFLQRAADVGLSPTGSIVEDDDQINRILEKGNVQTLILERPKIGILGRTLGRWRWIEGLLMRAPCSVLLLAREPEKPPHIQEDLRNSWRI